MHGLTITAVTVSKDLARNILTTAIEAGHTHGIGYWAEVTQITRDNAGYVEAIELVEREAYDKDTPKRTRIVHCSHMEKAIRQLLNTGAGSRLVGDDLDGPLADAIVQVACFGDVIYG